MLVDHVLLVLFCCLILVFGCLLIFRGCWIMLCFFLFNGSVLAFFFGGGMLTFRLCWVFCSFLVGCHNGQCCLAHISFGFGVSWGTPLLSPERSQGGRFLALGAWRLGFGGFRKGSFPSLFLDHVFWFFSLPVLFWGVIFSLISGSLV